MKGTAVSHTSKPPFLNMQMKIYGVLSDALSTSLDPIMAQIPWTLLSSFSCTQNGMVSVNVSVRVGVQDTDLGRLHT